MSDYGNDRVWSDQFIPEVRRLVGPHLLVPAPFEVDAHQAGDLVLMASGDVTVAVRVRRPGYAKRFPFDITIRSARDNGVRTELTKIRDGFGSMMFYGHATSDDPDDGICRWFLIDLDVFRALLYGGWLGKEVSNRDGTWFRSFNLADRQVRTSGLVLASNRMDDLRDTAPVVRRLEHAGPVSQLGLWSAK